MHRRILSLTLIGFLSIIIINWGCTKLDTTSLGSDLIPVVDNVNTFADTLTVIASQSDYTDTTIVLNTDNHALGNITFDPLFGKTEASIYLQLKPGFFPFAFGPKDSITGPNAGLDSVVLCLSYKGAYGDTNQLQQLNVYEVTDTRFKDSTYNTKDFVPNIGAQIGTKTVDIRTLDEYMKYAYINDSVQYQIRIKLDPLFAKRIFESDSTLTGSGNHAFKNDSIYLHEFNGLAIKPAIGMGNALMYINLADTNTKLEVHYRMRAANGRIDTIYSPFRIRLATASTTAGVTHASAIVNHIVRDRTGSPSETPTSDAIYLQTQPGTYANLRIDSLTGYSNRIIHRAELIIEQIPDNPTTDSLFSAPGFLYLDLKDTGSTVKYKPIYTDLNPNVFYNPDDPYFFYPYDPGPDFQYYGGVQRWKTGPFGGSIVYYNINISRYVQQMVKNQGINYNLRLFPAFSIHYGQKSAYVPYNNSLAFGRVRVGSGSNPNYRMRLRIIYSRIK